MKMRLLLLLVFILSFALGGCDSGSSNSSKNKPNPALPDVTQAQFTNPTLIDNDHLPLIPETTHVFRAETEDGLETIVVEVLAETRVVAGVTCIVVHDQVALDDILIEDTYDWFAQDDEGNVWYFGEESISYEYDDEGNLLDASDDGSWEAGVDGALPGIVMLATPNIGDTYYQEYYEGVAEDAAEVVALDVAVTLSDGTSYLCLKTLDWNPLEKNSKEYKYYAPGIGLVKEEDVGGDEVVEIKGIFLRDVNESLPDFTAAVYTNPTIIDNTYLPFIPGSVNTYEAETEDGLETIVVEVLAETRVVAGVTCVVVSDQVSLDGVLIEDTRDWFAQDDAGNVWYLGEEVVNYEYDDQGNLIGTNEDGSWEAGVDGALAGVVMWSDPVVGISYYQEYLIDEAEDMGYVVASGVEVELTDGTIYENCLQTLDWNPLEPFALEYKYYAPDIGLVLEENVDTDEIVELISIE